MKLLELRANQPSFRTVTFNETGISLIVGKKRSTDKKKTYNSVGKSLTIALIHFCLASNKNQEFEDKLIGWEFELDFSIKGTKYTSKRNTQNQSKIFLNDKELTLTQFRKQLGQELFLLTEPIKFLTFRSLISRFIRPYKSSYVHYNKFVYKEQDYPRLLNNAYLLGLDITRVQNKHRLKDELDKAKDLKSKIEKDGIMKSFFDSSSEADVDIKVVELSTKISKIEKSIATFRIAEDYDDIRKEADEISAQLRTYKLQETSLKNAIRNIDKSLEIKPDITRNKILELYNKADIQLGQLVLKKLEDVEDFNKKLLANRGLRLMQEKNKFERQLKDVNQTIKKLAKLEDKKLQYLNSHGALDDYTQLNKQLSDYTIQLEKLQQYKKLVNEYKNKFEEVKSDFSKENIETNNYLEKEFNTISDNIQIFQSFAEKFYENKQAGITVSNNESNENKLRYNINAKIQDDRGDGVNEVKIFCFDWTLLKGQHNHKIEFLFHDGRILSEIDPRQVATMFKVAFENSIKNNFQYIISANQNVLDAIRAEMTENEYSKIILESEILELNDLSEKSKLLGIQIDLDYEKQ